MAFDQSTRNRLQRFVTDARRTLEEEFTRQLQNDYGLDPVSGTASPLESLRHINDQQRETARILRDTLAHYCASADTDTKAGLDRIVREQAFTVLNRLAALRMAEARGLLMESVGNGYQARGFQLYARLAGTGLGETGDAYRVYLQSVFDELSQDLPGLFDRFSPQGRLFPREAALIQVLTLINHGEIEPLWAEDETIGWIYQYFNSKEERKAMRDASQAPRNSRELAVRNQFFTPRYVVEFLVDNTLGRLWFNWTGGQTGLRDRCQYLLVKPDEKPEPAKRLRDPRTIKLLDPACGSMHFGLYAFDLFLEIYREAWAWEQTHGPGCLDTETGGSADLKPLSQTYADQDAFLHDVPRLIIEHNIYGVDIDPRAAQIASLALWLRAQRAWHQAGVKAKDRPQVGRGHVVAAVAPPAEVDLRKRFMEELDALDAELFEKTLFLLKGLPELGVLLQVEKELPALVRGVFGEHGDLFREEDMAQWQKAETRLHEALTEFARAARSTYQGRLFAEDALDALRFIDLMSLHMDVVVMNPPFGKTSKEAEGYIKTAYPDAWTDVYGSFIWRFIATEKQPDFLGCITSALFMYTKPMRAIRKCWVDNLSLSILVELGSGVLDGATVDTALTISTRAQNKRTQFLDLTKEKIKEEALILPEYTSIELSAFSNLYLNPLSYHVSPLKLKLWEQLPTLDPQIGTVTKGNQTFDDFRFQRLRWEVKSDSIGNRWFGYEEGGEFQPYLSPTPLVYNWSCDGVEARAFQIGKYGTDAQVKQSIGWWYKSGITFPRVSSIGFGPRLMPVGNIFSGDSVSIFLNSEGMLLSLLAFLASSWAEDLSIAFGRHRKIEVRAIANIPIPEFSLSTNEALAVLADRAIQIMIDVESANETSALFVAPLRDSTNYPSLLRNLENREGLKSISKSIDQIVETALFPEGEVPELSVARREELVLKYVREKDFSELGADWFSWLVGCAFGRWDTNAMHNQIQVGSSSLLMLGLPPNAPGENAGRSTEFSPSILVDDPTNESDILEKIRNLRIGHDVSSEEIDVWLTETLDAGSTREYLRKTAGFFGHHLAKYSRSSRRAPIYWPISTSSGSYTLWLYYPSLTDQTLFTAVNDFIEPKLKQVGQDVAALRSKGSARSRDDEKNFEALQALELELIELRDTLLAIAPTYRPNHDDGVQITAAPLWQLFRHKPWQKILKDTWAKLEKGDYDWAHLAMAYWPDRVRQKCKTDKSLAIAHDLEHLYVEPDLKPTKARGRKKDG